MLRGIKSDDDDRFKAEFNVNFTGAKMRAKMSSSKKQPASGVYTQ